MEIRHYIAIVVILICSLLLEPTFMNPVDKIHLVDKRALARNSNQPRRNKKKCCGDQGSIGRKEINSRQESEQKKLEEKIVSEMQYIRPKKRLRERQGGNGGLSRLRAYGVFTDQGIHISCAGCPSGWPDMLTVYPEFEVGIPIICSNCPTNWPGALNLLGVGGDPSWGQSNDPPINGDRSAGNNFMTFDTGSNFGGGRDNAFPASDYGGDGSDNYYGNLDGVDPGGLGQNEGLPTSDMT